MDHWDIAIDGASHEPITHPPPKSCAGRSRLEAREAIRAGEAGKAWEIAPVIMPRFQPSPTLSSQAAPRAGLRTPSGIFLPTRGHEDP